LVYGDTLLPICGEVATKVFFKPPRGFVSYADKRSAAFLVNTWKINDIVPADNAAVKENDVDIRAVELMDYA